MERKEAIEVVKKNYPHCAESGTQFETALRTLIPELQESEDEKIRKEIITFIVTTPKQRNSHSKWIAWLEKQGEQKSIPQEYADAFDEFMSHIPEKEPEFSESCYNYDDMVSAIQFGIKWQQQHNSVVKVEPKYGPKFHEGEWVVNTLTKEVEQIIELTGSEYICSGHLIVSYNEQHLLKSWTIQDAKDGDVLVTKIKKCPFIYRKTSYNHDLAYYYVGIDCNGELDHTYPKNTQYHFGSVSNVTPATKVQRETFFAKMKEEGYEWDAEKKELKKIPQRMVSAEAKEALYDNPAEWIEDYWRHHKIINPESYDKGEEIQFDHDGFVRFCKKYCEKPAEWSEEDEVKINRIVACLENLNVPDNDILLKDVEWLKSLKDRVQPQPKQEWSEEDYYMLGKVLECIRFAEDHYQLEDEEVHGVDVRLWLLKSLKPQPHWKPTDEQMADLWNMVCECRPADQQLLQDIYYGLKILKEE